MQTKQIDPTISTIAALLGARGGASKTKKKVEASRRTIKKAIAARWSKKRSTT